MALDSTARLGDPRPVTVELSRPLRPEQYTHVPFRDSTSLVGNDAALAARARRDGYLYLRGVIPAAAIDPVRAFVRAYCLNLGWAVPDDENPPQLLASRTAGLTGRGWDDPRFVELQRQLRSLDAFQRLGNQAEILRVLGVVAGGDVWMATTNYCWIKFPGSPAQTTRPHQDSFYLPGVPSLWTGWVPLVDTPLELGPLGVVPGSHSRRLEHVSNITGIDMPEGTVWATGPVLAGDIVLFDADTVHCAWSNVSSCLVRLSLDIRYEIKPGEGTTALRPIA
jgi:hypothetical protein